MTVKPDMITILGHTAAGKTGIAASVAFKVGGEVISADSRQVYRDMSVGTGKDLDDYIVNDRMVPVHLVDIRDAGEEYNVFEFQKDFHLAFGGIRSRGMIPVLCGGSGMYLEAVLRGYDMIKVPVNKDLRESLEGKSLEELGRILSSYRDLHNNTDTDTVKRAIRAIEIADFMKKEVSAVDNFPPPASLTFGIRYERDERRSRITRRLMQRLEEGMIEEAEALLARGISHDKLEYYGLEYKYLSLYLKGELSYEEMIERLNTAIHQFAKRQMTYFRGMERRGIKIHWLQGEEDHAVLADRIADAWQSI